MKGWDEKFAEKNNALEGIFWTFGKRLKVLDELYGQYWLLTPQKAKPLVKSFDSLKQYETWRRKQKNPWYR